MIFNDPIQDITWAMVEEFCQASLAESTVIEYKRDFPNHLESSIAAMANTLGGLILIGIETDQQEKPITPIAGIEGGRRLELRVADICEGAIFPPVIAEVKACPNADQSRFVVVIRVPISRLTHATERNTQVYVRTGNRNSHNQLADVAKIEWLLGLRKSREIEREEMIDRARGRFEPMIRTAAREVRQTTPEHAFHRHWFEAYATPTFPLAKLSSSEMSVEKLASEVVRLTDPELSVIFPTSLSATRGRYVFGGFAFASMTEHDPPRGSFHEISEQGLFYLRERLSFDHPHLANVNIIWGGEIAKFILMFLTATNELYETVHYLGPIEIGLSFHGIDGLGDIRYVPLGVALTAAGHIYSCPDAVIKTQRSTSTFELKANLIELVVEVVLQFNMAFNDRTPEDRIRKAVNTLHESL